MPLKLHSKVSQLFFCLLLLLSFPAVASSQLQCVVPAISEPMQVVDFDFLLYPEAVVIEADTTELDENGNARFTGQVNIFQGINQIQADVANIERGSENLKADGDIQFSNASVLVTSSALNADKAQSRLQLESAQYQLLQLDGHGAANLIELNEADNQILLNQASFSSCPDLESPDWRLNSSEINLDLKNQWGTAWHSTFEVAGQPVMYLPYLAFPLDDSRKSGLLLPEMGSSESNGLDYYQPYYINIAPNMDATIGARLISKRGTQYRGEFRYLTQTSNGRFYGEWLGNDDESNISENRSSFSFFHQGKVWRDWSIRTDSSFIGDDNYINELGYQNFNRSDTHIERYISLYQEQTDWFVNVSIRDFEVFGDHLKPYRTLPEIEAAYYPESGIDSLDLSLPLQMAWFQSSDEVLEDALRFHLEPTATWIWSQPAWEVQLESSMLATVYQENAFGQNESNERVRTMPRARANAHFVFEKPIDWFGNDMTQTLEPRVQYLWVPYRDQSEIQLYDSVLLQDDYWGLFRANRFSSVDRIPEANQLTLGVTNRMINNRNQQKAQLSIGQIFYFTESRTDLVQSDQERGESALALDIDLDIRNRWFFHYGLQQDMELDRENKSQLTVDYRDDDDTTVQVSKRFVRDVSGNKIDLLGFNASWKLDSDYQFYASHYIDRDKARGVESRLGFVYKSCCWSIQLGWQAKLLTDFDTNDSALLGRRDTGFVLRFSLGNFGGGRFGSSEQLLQQGIFGYRKPYYLNQ